jgi:hypothetical protein
VVKWLTLLLRIPEASGSKFPPGDRLSWQVYCGFTQSLTAIAGMVSYNYASTASYQIRFISSSTYRPLIRHCTVCISEKASVNKHNYDLRVKCFPGLNVVCRHGPVYQAFFLFLFSISFLTLYLNISFPPVSFPLFSTSFLSFSYILITSSVFVFSPPAYIFFLLLSVSLYLSSTPILAVFSF